MSPIKQFQWITPSSRYVIWVSCGILRTRVTQRSAHCKLPAQHSPAAASSARLHSPTDQSKALNVLKFSRNETASVPPFLPDCYFTCLWTFGAKGTRKTSHCSLCIMLQYAIQQGMWDCTRNRKCLVKQNQLPCFLEKGLENKLKILIDGFISDQKHNVPATSMLTFLAWL